jgi:hypothetical protein
MLSYEIEWNPESHCEFQGYQPTQFREETPGRVSVV